MSANVSTLATQDAGAIMEEVIAKGDLAKLTPEQRARYYTTVCQSLGINPLTRPFEYITLNNKLTLYATRTAADQLRKIHNVSIRIVDRTIADDVLEVTARATLPNGREDEEIGAVTIAGLKGEARANASMKAITKAKRRVTLSIVGLGWLDETEVETIPNAQAVVPPIDIETRQPVPVESTIIDATPTSESNAVEQPATARQLKFIQAIARERGLIDESLDAEGMRSVGATVADMTRRQASSFIEHLNGLPPFWDADAGESQPNERSDVATPPTSHPTDETANARPAPLQRETKASDDKRTKALRVLHAAGKGFVPPGEEDGLSHADLSAIAALRYGLDSLAALVADDLDRLTTWLNGIHPDGRTLYMGWFADMIRAGDAIDQALASEVVRKLRDEWKSAGISDPMLWECWRRTVAALAAKFGKQPKDEPNDGPPIEGGQLPNMPPPVEVAGDDRFTQ